eukprot:GHVN01074087.1.p1 GENE.GHVN01074087.1~~GHVN01074087.1.p1  ORF type:complete len:381 (-),score=44.07 GHVN01074087.1:1279-2421(-)
MLVVMKKSPEEAFAPFLTSSIDFVPFRDATYGICSCNLTILDCLKGLDYAMKLGWFNYQLFDCEEYETYEKVENGDLNWIIPNRFVAFSGPSSTTTDDEGFAALTPEDYIPIFKRLGISMVMRLNKKQYDRRRFIESGLKHVDLYFLDGSCPSREIITKFLDITEREICGHSAVAVHCKAGLGRTGTLIGCYAIKNFRFHATPWIGWNRICRPGSVLGPQQHFLREIQSELLQMGASKHIHRPVASPQVNKVSKPSLNSAGGDGMGLEEHELIFRLQKSLTFDERRVADRGEAGQGERLVLIKRTHGQQGGREWDATPAESEGSPASHQGETTNPGGDMYQFPGGKETFDNVFWNEKDKTVASRRHGEVRDKEKRQGKQN